MISLIVPVYNEAENIGRLLVEIKSKINVPLELVVVYDNDEDNTIPMINKLSPFYDFKINLVKNHWGKGALNAIKTGFKEAGQEAILVVMADLADDLEVVNEMYELNRQGYDVVCGSRYMLGGGQIGGPWLKKTISRMAGVSLHYLARIPTHDVTNSFKMYSKRLINNIEIESTGGFEIGMEITVKAFIYGYKITEVPSIWTDREAGVSRFKMWEWMPNYLHWYGFALRKKNNINFEQRKKGVSG